jgi:hypothetical protein
VWLEPAVANRLGAMRGPSESYGDVIIRLASASYRPLRVGIFWKRAAERRCAGAALFERKARLRAFTQSIYRNRLTQNL